VKGMRAAGHRERKRERARGAHCSTRWDWEATTEGLVDSWIRRFVDS